MLRPLILMLSVGLGCVVPAGLAQEPQADNGKPKATQYLRLARDPAGRPTALEAAVVQFVPRDCGRTSPTVDLIGAVHIADRAYYEQLNRQFEGYDAVLYELVARPGTKIPTADSKKSPNVLSTIQRGLKDLLELEFQLDSVHYDRPNMIHADMSPEQMARSMRDRGESFAGMFMRLLAYAWSHQTNDPLDSSDFQILAALFDKNRAMALKRLMAEQFQDMEGSLTAIEGAQGSTLISERNRVALEVLKKELAAGKQKVAIFYGAGHMPNMEQRLRDDFDLVPIQTRWLAAWNLKDKAK